MRETSPKSRKDITVEVHREHMGECYVFELEYLNPDGHAIDVVESITVTHSTSAPHHTAILRVNLPTSNLPLGGIPGPLHPIPGDWLVIKYFVPNEHGSPLSSWEDAVGWAETGKSEILDIRGPLGTEALELEFTDSGLAVTNTKPVGTQRSGPDSHDGDQAINCFMGRVSRLTAGIKAQSGVGGEIQVNSYAVFVDSWYDYLSSVQIALMLEDNINVGTLMSRMTYAKHWANFAGKNIAQVNSANGLASLLSQLLKIAARVTLPKTLLGGAVLGDAIKVVGTPTSASKETGQFIRQSANQYNSNWILKPRVCEEILGWKWQGTDTWNPQTSTIRDLIVGSFGADPNMIELFPTMEATNNQFVTKRKTVFNQNGITFDPGTATAGADPSKPFNLAEWNADDSDAQNQRGDELASTAGFVPTLMYRMRPWRAESLKGFLKRNKGLKKPIGKKSDEQIKQEAALANASDPLAQAKKFTEALVNAAPAKAPVENIPKAKYPPTFGRYGGDVEHEFSADEIVSVDWGQTDNDLVTVTTIDMFNDTYGTLSFSSNMGLPYYSPSQVRKHGVRLFKLQWPFWSFASSKEDTTGGLQNAALIQYWQSLAQTAYQFTASMYLMVRGSAVLLYNPQINAGCCVALELTASVNRSSMLPHSDIFPTTPYRKESLEQEPVTLYAYIEAVEHSVSTRANGEVVRLTKIQFSRGLFNEDFSDPNNARLNAYEWDGTDY